MNPPPPVTRTFTSLAAFRSRPAELGSVKADALADTVPSGPCYLHCPLRPARQRAPGTNEFTARPP